MVGRRALHTRGGADLGPRGGAREKAWGANRVLARLDDGRRAGLVGAWIERGAELSGIGTVTAKRREAAVARGTKEWQG